MVIKRKVLWKVMGIMMFVSLSSLFSAKPQRVKSRGGCRLWCASVSGFSTFSFFSFLPPSFRFLIKQKIVKFSLDTLNNCFVIARVSRSLFASHAREWGLTLTSFDMRSLTRTEENTSFRTNA